MSSNSCNPAPLHPARKTLPPWLIYLVFLCAALMLASPAQAQNAIDPRLLRLLGLMQQRLDVAQDVAMYKWNAKAAIDDPVREQQILDALAKQAPQYGLEPKLAQDFFAAQIIAGKMIQTALFKEWTSKSQAPFSDPPDLKTQIRPALDRLTIELLTALAAAQPVLQDKDSQQELELAATNSSVRAGVSQTVPGYAAAWQQALGVLVRREK
ncbi:gamma subclass chorismate mutase AroQ [Undibacterium umbellatum]|jgi:chorismate mutase|uniref:chorismate mutase n=1 Tax=Undibacterium umbellatum TaxID=2762300 RepID=A0ABR6Z7X1_9BURK|nr:gamma subclass chorismate mutase AroQ [Undibacterium umbellatum]MBC3907850.1 gamma subclass chorismate mutase AroQ [Undibacterium umbellatum]